MTTPTPIPDAAVTPDPVALKAAALARHSHACDGGYSIVGSLAADAAVRAYLAALPRLASPAVESALFQREIEQLHERLAAAGTARDALAERLRALEVRPQTHDVEDGPEGWRDAR